MLKDYPATDHTAAKQFGPGSSEDDASPEPSFAPISPCVNEPINLARPDPQREFLARAQQHPELGSVAQNSVSPVPFQDAVKECEKMERYQPGAEVSDGFKNIQWDGNDAEAAARFASTDITGRNFPIQQNMARLKELLGAHASQQQGAFESFLEFVLTWYGTIGLELSLIAIEPFRRLAKEMENEFRGGARKAIRDALTGDPTRVGARFKSLRDEAAAALKAANKWKLAKKCHHSPSALSH